MKKILSMMIVILMMLQLLPMQIFAADSPAFVMDNVSGMHGNTVSVNISLVNNPGIASTTLIISFDQEAVTLTDIVFNSAELGGIPQLPPKKDGKYNSGSKLVWINGGENTYGDMVFATLTFQIDTEVVGEYDITMTYDPDDVYDITETNIDFAIENGSITVTEAPKEDLPDSITFSDKTVIYNGEEQSVEIAGTLPEGVTVAYENNTAVNAGTYEATATISGKGYNAKVLTAALTIEPKMANITGLVAEDKTYDSTPAAEIDATAAVLEGIVEGDDVYLESVSDGEFLSFSVGTWPVDYTAVVGGADKDNYKIIKPAQALTATIEKAPLEITLKSYTINTGDEIPVLEWEITGGKLFADDKIDGEPEYSIAARSTVIYKITEGTLAVYGKLSDGTTYKSNNYDVTFVPGTLVIADILVESVTLDKTELTLLASKNETAQLTATITPADATNKNIIWTSSNESVAKVGETGEVIAVGEGTATITASAEGTDISASCVVTVPHEHKLTHVDAVEATCVIKAVNEYWSCTCGVLFADKEGKTETTLDKLTGEVDAANHVNTEVIGAVAATEYAGGYTGDTYCTDCDKLVAEGENTPKLDHTHAMQYHKAVESTCVTNGTVEYWHCTKEDLCGKNYADEEGGVELTDLNAPLNPDNHEGETEIVGYVAETCTTNGYTGDTVYSCCKVEVSKGEVIPASNHVNAGDWQYDGENHWKHCPDCDTDINTATHAGGMPTCVSKAVCSTCGTSYGEMLDHDLVKTEAVDPECGVEGNIEYWTCESCGGIFADEEAENKIIEKNTVIPALEHNYIAETLVEPTCVDKGYTTYTCEYCGDSYDADFTAALGHKWGAWDITREPTDTEDGEAERVCTVCDEVETRTVAKITVPVSDENENSEEQDVKVNVFTGADSSDVEVQIDENDLNAKLEELGVSEGADGSAEGMITIDVEAVADQIESVEAVNQVTIPTQSVTKVAEAAADENNATTGLQIKLTSGTVQFDADALAAIAANAESESAGVALSIESVAGDSAEADEVVEVLSERMNETQKEILTEIHENIETDILGAVDVNLTGATSNESIGNFDGGKVTISIPFDIGNYNPNGFTIVYIYEDGTVEELEAVYENGCLVFTVEHFSAYIITYTEPEEEPAPDVEEDDDTDSVAEQLRKYWIMMQMLEKKKKEEIVPELPEIDVPVIPEIDYSEKSAADFTDVNPDAWYYDAVDYVAAKRLMNGVSDTEFAPDAEMTRAMLVTILWRMEGEPAAEKASSFADVEYGMYYTEAIAWAAENGIVNGISENLFAPNDFITREQMAVIFYRHAIFNGLEGVTMAEYVEGYNDSADVSEYAVSALNWAIGAGLINGVGDNNLAPKSTATRAQTAAIITRYLAD